MKNRLPYLDVGFDRGKMIGGDSDLLSSVKTSSLKIPPHPLKPINTLGCTFLITWKFPSNDKKLICHWFKSIYILPPKGLDPPWMCRPLRMMTGRKSFPGEKKVAKKLLRKSNVQHFIEVTSSSERLCLAFVMSPSASSMKNCLPISAGSFPYLEKKLVIAQYRFHSRPHIS